MTLTANNLVPIQSGIALKAGQRVIKIGTAFVPVGIGGNFEPGSGGSAEYYRCASVDTAAKTWTGYKAVLTNGGYAFESTVTTGLTYTSVTPVVGSIYSADALAKVDSLYIGIPTNGLVFYAPLSSNQATAETGQVLNKNGSITSTIDEGIPCSYFNNAYFNTNIGYDLGYSWTLSFWLKVVTDNSPGLAFFNATDFTEILIYINENSKQLRFYPPDDTGTTTDYYKWNNYIIINDGSVCSIYENGVLLTDKNWDNRKNFNSFTIGRRYSSGMKGYCSGIRIYNKKLTQPEIAALAAEFTPTA